MTVPTAISIMSLHAISYYCPVEIVPAKGLRRILASPPAKYQRSRLVGPSETE